MGPKTPDKRLFDKHSSSECAATPRDANVWAFIGRAAFDLDVLRADWCSRLASVGLKVILGAPKGGLRYLTRAEVFKHAQAVNAAMGRRSAGPPSLQAVLRHVQRTKKLPRAKESFTCYAFSVQIPQTGINTTGLSVDAPADMSVFLSFRDDPAIKQFLYPESPVFKKYLVRTGEKCVTSSPRVPLFTIMNDAVPYGELRELITDFVEPQLPASVTFKPVSVVYSQQILS